MGYYKFDVLIDINAILFNIVHNCMEYIEGGSQIFNFSHLFVFLDEMINTIKNSHVIAKIFNPI